MAHFVILGTQRTGTTLLKTTLHNHPEIHCAGELFIERTLRRRLRRMQLGKKGGKLSPLAYWSWTHAELTRSRRLLELVGYQRDELTDEFLTQLFRQNLAPSIGFKLMFNQSNKYPAVIRWCLDNELKLIHVVRENYLKTLVSIRMMSLRPRAHTRKDHVVNKAVKVTLNCRKLERQLGEIEASNKGWADMVVESPRYLKLSYENFVHERERWLARVFEHLEVPVCDVASPLKKINPEHLSDSVKNYAEVRASLRGSRYESLLD